MKYMLHGREVEIIETEFELGEGAYVIDAVFADNNAELSDADLDKLNEVYASEIYEDKYIDMCADAYDRAKAARYDD